MAPIIRAASSQSGKKLLGDGIRRQLHRDGIMNRLTFVPSKINEIDIKEILPVLRQDPEFAREYDSIESARKEVMGKTNAASAKVQDLKQRLEHITAQAKEAHTEQKVYKTLKKLHESGKPAYSPIEQKHRAKRQRVAMTLNGSRHPLAGEDIQQKLDELDELREELDDECQRLAMKLEEACQEKKNGEQKIKACRGEAWFACVRRRNEQSIKDIQRDFVQVMRELNEDNSLDGTHGEPTEDVYDDEALAQMLPVKCVPARGYKKLTGGMQGQRVAAHFHNEAATGITALRDHAYQLAEDKMLAADEAFINEAKRLLNSLRLWCIGSSGTQGLAIAAIIDEPKYRKFVDNFIKVESSPYVAYYRTDTYTASVRNYPEDHVTHFGSNQNERDQQPSPRCTVRQ